MRREALPLRDANLEAVRRLEAWLEATLMVHRSVGVETVLSTPKYRRLVDLAKAKGFSVRLVYVVLNSPDLNVQRVRARVAAGGHNVPEAKIVERYWRSLEQLPWFLDQSDQAWIYDNSGPSIITIAEKRDGIVSIQQDAVPAVVAAVARIGKDTAYSVVSKSGHHFCGSKNATRQSVRALVLIQSERERL